MSRAGMETLFACRCGSYRQIFERPLLKHFAEFLRLR